MKGQMSQANGQRREGIPLPRRCYVVARIENFNDLDADCANQNCDDAYCTLGTMEEAFTIEQCRLSTDETDMIPALIDVPADLDDTKPVRAHFGFSRFVPDEKNNRLIAFYNYKHIR